MKIASNSTPKFLKTRRGIILLLAGLLIFYHVSLVYDLYLGAKAGDQPTMIDLQSFLRIAIATSLTLVVFGVRRALWGMWLSISALIITQYIVHYGPNPPEFTLSRSGFSYLRGFIFPTIITLVFPYGHKSLRNTEPAPDKNDGNVPVQE